jgi:hypothetical protein
MAACFKTASSQLVLLFLVLFVAVVLFSSAMYFAEKDEPDTDFTSIPGL